ALEETALQLFPDTCLERLLIAVGLGDPAKRLKTVTDEVRGMLQSKAKSLGDLVKPMETQVEEESGKIILEVSRMSTLEQGYRDTIVSLGVFVEAG
ncbi:Toxic anion resistance protein (TelA), partial [Rhizobium ruizarguesonis]